MAADKDTLEKIASTYDSTTDFDYRLIRVHMGLLPAPNAFSDRDRRFGHRRVYDIDLLRLHLTQAGWRVDAIRGVFLKTLANAQMAQFTPDLLHGFFEVGKELPRYC